MGHPSNRRCGPRRPTDGPSWDEAAAWRMRAGWQGPTPLGWVLRAQRAPRAMSPRELARVAGVRPGLVESLESGERRSVTTDTCAALAHGLGRSVRQLDGLVAARRLAGAEHRRGAWISDAHAVGTRTGPATIQPGRIDMGGQGGLAAGERKDATTEDTAVAGDGPRTRAGCRRHTLTTPERLASWHR